MTTNVTVVFVRFSTPNNQCKGVCLRLLALMQSQDGHELRYAKKKVCPKISFNKYLAANMGNFTRNLSKLISFKDAIKHFYKS